MHYGSQRQDNGKWEQRQDGVYGRNIAGRKIGSAYFVVKNPAFCSLSVTALSNASAVRSVLWQAGVLTSAVVFIRI